VTVNFAPCADVALDPSNPVIGARSYGADPMLVARHTRAFIEGHQAAGVAACVKHYPGHGGTDADTHRRLAVLAEDLPQLWDNALPPFAAAIDAGVDAVMAGHLSAPAVDGLPASISRRWLTDILRGEMGFTGVIITDALEMQALADTYGLADSAVAALVAGADLLCLGGESRFEDELDAIVAAIVAAVGDGRLSIDRLADAADRVTGLGRRTRPDAVTDPPPLAPDSNVSAQVARRAVQVAGPLPPWHAPALVLRCADRPNIAVGEVPWGPATVDPTLTEITVDPHGPLPADRIVAAGSVVLVTRDRHRQPWMIERLRQVRALRMDAVLLEMGTTGVGDVDAPAVASYGATPANARAALAALGALGAPGAPGAHRHAPE
jgi:beta-N-acetylhexosaminidase